MSTEQKTKKNKPFYEQFPASQGYDWAAHEAPPFQSKKVNTEHRLVKKVRENYGTAVYLHYPRFEGRSKNALVIGGKDIGASIGDPTIPVGHDELLTIDSNNNVNLIRYGRYTTGSGYLRPTVKGGNWGIFNMPSKKENESVQEYVKRISPNLEDSKFGPFEGIKIDNVNIAKMQETANRQSWDKNRPEYSITNTCATGASNVLNAGLGTEQFSNISSNASFFSPADNIATGLWSLLPYSTGTYARDARGIGESFVVNP